MVLDLAVGWTLRGNPHLTRNPVWFCRYTAGKVISDTPRVLPRNLKDVCFSSIIAVKGAADPASKVNEFIVWYTEYAKRIEFDGDPFFQGWCSTFFFSPPPPPPI